MNIIPNSMIRQVLFYVFLVSILSTPLTAQIGDTQGGSFNFNNELSQRASVPLSPEAAAFARYRDVGVNMYSGTPSISVPIYTHKGRELNLPINLSYDASGIKVTQKPTLVGTGWNLNVGGRISRQVNGLPDDFLPTSSGPYTSWYDPTVTSKMTTYAQPEYQFGDNADPSKNFSSAQAARNYLSFLRDVHEQKYETQPDYYTLNVMGLNETFVLDLNTKNPFSLNNPNTKIERSAFDTNNNIATFTVTSENGTKYTFTATEQTKIQKTSDTGTHFFYGTIVYYTSSWYLTRIDSPLGKDVYEFEYSTYTDLREREYTPVVIEKSTIITNQIENRNSATSYSSKTVDVYDKKYLHKIKHNSKVFAEFTITNELGGGPDAAIDKIKVYGNGSASGGTSSSLMKVFDLNYSYFKTDSDIVITSPGNRQQVRLKLDDVRIEDATQTEVYAYTFEYDNPDDISSLTDNGQDYLGFYNGHSNPNGLIRGTSSSENTYPPSFGHTFSGSGGANRNPNFGFAKRGILTKITYPTGGSSQFEYEGATEKVPIQSTTSSQMTKASLQVSSTSLIPLDNTTCNKTLLNGNEYSAKTAHQNFTIDANGIGTHQVIFSKTGTPTHTGLSPEINQFVLIKTPDSTTSYDWNEIYGSNCEFLLNFTDLVYAYNGNQASFQDSFYLEEGHYQLVLLLYDIGLSKDLEIVGPHTSIVTEYEDVARAGLRIKEITDFTEDGVQAKEKQYTYNQAVAITRPQLEYLTLERYRDESSAGESVINRDYQILHRVATALNGDKQHIIYPSVTEAIVDFADPTKALHKTTRYKIPSLSDGTYGSGTYTVPLSGGTYSATNYARNPSLGQMKSSSTSTSFSSNTFNDDTIYYDTFGIALGVLGRNNNLFPTIQVIGGVHKIKLEQGILYPFFSSASLGGGSGSFSAVQPPECNGEVDCTPEIARLFIHKTNAYGRHGGDVNTSTSTQDGVTTTTAYTYTSGDRRYVKEMTTTYSDGRYNKTIYTYPHELSGTSGYSHLTNANILSNPVHIEISSENGGVSTVITEYNTSKLPTKINVRKASEQAEDRMVFEQYLNGNLVQARQTDGTPISFIWGYNDRYVVAKIVNSTYNDLNASLVNQIRSHSNGTNEAALLSSLAALQNHASLDNAQMTYYTYAPNIGVTTTTDVTGYRVRYIYDDFQRLLKTVDADNKVVTKYAYNYKPPVPEDPPYVPMNSGPLEVLPNNTTPGNTIYYSGYLSNFSGGEGPYTFKWYRKVGTNGVFVLFDTTSVNSYSFQYDLDDPNFCDGVNYSIQIKCEVTDGTTNGPYQKLSTETVLHCNIDHQ